MVCGWEGRGRAHTCNGFFQLLLEIMSDVIYELVFHETHHKGAKSTWFTEQRSKQKVGTGQHPLFVCTFCNTIIYVCITHIRCK